MRQVAHELGSTSKAQVQTSGNGPRSKEEQGKNKEMGAREGHSKTSLSYRWMT